MKLLRIMKSPKEGYKLVATFLIGDREKEVHFGADKYMDYILYYKKEGKEVADMRRDAYIARHKVNESLLWKNEPMSRASLSRWILWEKPTLVEAVDSYRKRFSL